MDFPCTKPLTIDIILNFSVICRFLFTVNGRILSAFVYYLHPLWLMKYHEKNIYILERNLSNSMKNVFNYRYIFPSYVGNIWKIITTVYWKIVFFCFVFKFVYCESWFRANQSLLLLLIAACFSGETTNITNFIIFGLTRSRLKPTIYRTRGKHANHNTTDVFWINTNMNVHNYYIFRLYK